MTWQYFAVDRSGERRMSEEQAPVDAPFCLAEILGAAAIDPIEVLDVGAMAEGRPRYDALSRQGLCRVTGFEMNSDQIQRRKRRCLLGPKCCPSRSVMVARRRFM